MSTPLADVILRGSRSSQPAASSVCAGSLYYVIDEGKTERSTAVVWENYSDIGTSGVVLVNDTVVTADTTSVTFSALTGNTDIIYMLSGRIKNPLGVTCRYDWRPNNTATNQISFRATTNYATLVLGTAEAGGMVSFVATIAAAANPNSIATARTYSGTTTETTTVPAASGGAIGGVWNETATEITSIVVVASVAGGIGNGTTLALLRLT